MNHKAESNRLRIKAIASGHEDDEKAYCMHAWIYQRDLCPAILKKGYQPPLDTIPDGLRIVAYQPQPRS